MAKRPICSLCGYSFYYGTCPNIRCVGYHSSIGKTKKQLNKDWVNV